MVIPYPHRASPTRSDARFPRGAGRATSDERGAKRRQLAASGHLTPSASLRSPSTPLASAAPFPLSRRSFVLFAHRFATPSPRPSQPATVPAVPTALSSCRCRSFLLPPSLPPSLSLPADSHGPHTTVRASHLVPPRRASPRHPLSPHARPSSLPPLAGPRKRGIASNSNYRTRGYHASNLTLGRPTYGRASRLAPRRVPFFRRRFFSPETERASAATSIDF